MGGNCSGKTTVLHALACVHRPLQQGDPNYKFAQFFRPNTDAFWQGSNFTVHYSQRVDQHFYPDLVQSYTKTTDRWSPKYARRPERYTRFLSIGDSVPDVDSVTLASMIHYQKIENNDSISIHVRDAAGQILNRVYETFYRVTYNYTGRDSIGVRSGPVTYSGLSMSSGEQRVFRILDAVFRAPDYGLILVDELDLFLHQDALQRMLSLLQQHCEQRHKQLVFTTHFPPVAQMYEKMRIYTLHSTQTRTAIWQGYSYEAMRHITGIQERPIHCYFEDDVAQEIVARVASELGIRKFVQFGSYGPAVNAFSLCAGLQLSNADTNHTLAVLDGDVYGGWRARLQQVERVCTGNQPEHDEQRKRLMGLVRTLTPMRNAGGSPMSPEQVLHLMLHSINQANVPDDRTEVYQIGLGVVNVPEKHGFVNQIIDHTGESREVALSKIIELASLSASWRRYTRLIRAWLAKHKSQLNL